MTGTVEIDSSLILEFIDESDDALASIDEMVVRLESEHAPELLEAIFRPLHSVKGNAAFFGFPRVKDLAHVLESLLDLLRKHQLTPDATLITLLLRGIDQLREIFSRVRAGEQELSDPDAFHALLDELKELTRIPGPEKQWREILQTLQALPTGEATAPLRDGLTAVCDRIREMLPDDERPPADPWQITPEAARTLRNRLGDEPARQQPGFEKEIRTLISTLRQAAKDETAKSLTAQMQDNFETMVAAVGFDDLLAGLLQENLEEAVTTGTFQAITPQKTEVPAAPPTVEPQPAADEAGVEDDTPPPPRDDAPGKTMRISESHIDTFLHYVGELIVVNDMFLHVQRYLEDHHEEDEVLLESLKHANETFSTLSGNLQESILSIRRVPLRSLLQKAPRLVRDVAAVAGKNVDIQIEGDELQIDKSLLDLLDAPLTHIVRNAVDHGIEAPELRRALGKPETGQVRLTAQADEEAIHLFIRDDGAGLDEEAITRKGVSLGLLRPDQKATREQIVQLIFSSGLSTAQEVTEISGRGVGMDVVQHQMEQAGGAIQVDSQPGAGCTFHIQLPRSVTTQIMQGFLVEVDETYYMLPLEQVSQTLPLSTEQIHHATTESTFFAHNDNMIPLYSMRALLHQERLTACDQGSLAVILRSRSGPFALAINQVHGVRQVVLKTIHWPGITSRTIAGGALMGDGSVALVVNFEALSRIHLDAVELH